MTEPFTIEIRGSHDVEVFTVCSVLLSEFYEQLDADDIPCSLESESIKATGHWKAVLNSLTKWKGP